jgi:transposase
MIFLHYEYSIDQIRVMNPVIGLDISKGHSDGQVFLDKGQPYGKTIRFLYNREGLQQLLTVIADVQSKTGKSPAVILESTGLINF